MAKPIKETPILEGKDAVKFLENIQENRNSKHSQEQIAKIKENFSKLTSIAQF
jgi:hypothetical protein